MFKILGTSILMIVALAIAPAIYAHAFPDNSSPHVGAMLSAPPAAVKVWFNGKIAPVFSTLIVKDSAGKQVSKGKGEVASSDHTLLETTLPAGLPAGKYEVYWSVIAQDGHHTAGHFPFTIK